MILLSMFPSPTFHQLGINDELHTFSQASTFSFQSKKKKESHLPSFMLIFAYYCQPKFKNKKNISVDFSLLGTSLNEQTLGCWPNRKKKGCNSPGYLLLHKMSTRVVPLLSLTTQMNFQRCPHACTQSTSPLDSHYSATGAASPRHWGHIEWHWGNACHSRA